MPIRDVEEGQIQQEVLQKNVSPGISVSPHYSSFYVYGLNPGNMGFDNKIDSQWMFSPPNIGPDRF